LSTAIGLTIAVDKYIYLSKFRVYW